MTPATIRAWDGGDEMKREALLACLALALPPRPAAAQEDAALAHARALLAASPLVDGHNDLPWEIRDDPKAKGDVTLYDLRQRTAGETDLARLKEGGLAAQFWSVWVPAELKTGFARVQLEQIDLARRMVARYPEAMLLATRADDIRRAKREGKLASFLGMENGQALENSLGALRAYYELGVRYMTLTHWKTSDWADAATDKALHGGLTPFGKQVVREMNRLGMLVDISHVSAKTMADVLDVTQAPVIFSHSSAFALVDHPRNVPDAILSRMKANGGVVMVTFIPMFVSKEAREWGRGLEDATGSTMGTADLARLEADYEKSHGPAPKATLSQVADHIDHVAKVAGVDHVGIGSDFAGVPMPVGLEDVSRYPYLFAELIRRGWSDADLRKLAGENLIRTLEGAEATAARLQRETKASNATIEELDGKKP
jgi:membrane dipeptidase